MAVKLNQHDLEFILKQIEIAEAHAAGTPLTELIAQPHLPYGLRTVDGTYNNLIAGRENWGASDQPMPRLLDPSWRVETDNESVDINGPAPGGDVINNDYGNGGHVVDSDPRIITNLVADQTLKNPAAIIAALQFAEYEGDVLVAVNAIRAAYQTYLDAAGSAAQTALATLAAAHPNPADPPTAAEKAAAVEAAIEPLRTTLHEQLAADYGFEMDGNSIVLPNVAPDEGLSAPFNAWMTFFGQFFDHGLDLIHKGNNGTIFVPLAADDPLRTHGPDGIAGSGDEVPPSRAFMVLTRLDPTMTPGPDGVLGTADDVADAKNKTTPFIDQNQTYTSHPSHQVFLREYEMVFDEVLGHDVPMATGRLLDGAEGGLATWGDVKAQALNLLGIELSDIDVLGVPLLRTDPYGEFIRGEDGFPQVVVNIGPDMIPNTADDLTVSASPGNPVVLADLNGGLGPVRTSHQFLDDIAHNAAPVFDPNSPASLAPDPDTGTDAFGNPVPFDPNTGANLQYDNELLDRHFITGDGRGNENIGLTAVHHIFHSEHNRQIEDVKKQVLEIAASGRADDLAFLNEWLLVDVNTLPADTSTLKWDGERLFQTARFATEMQYQHLVFEEFGRKVQPNIDLFVFNTITDVNPAIFAEFAHTVYRFGHSMLTDHLKLLPLNDQGQPIGPDGQPLASAAGWQGIDVGLIEAFLNPVLYDNDGGITAEQAAGAIVRGLTYVRGNAIDEFVVESLRNNLLGLPLDLAAINLARGRDAGIPTLNEAREQLYAATSSSWLKPYESWADFGANLKTPASIINFLAAYGEHPLILAATTLEDKRDAAMALLGLGEPTDPDAIVIANGAFETDSLAPGAPGVTVDPLGNYTFTPPSGWTMTGVGGLFAPAAGIVDPTGLTGPNVAWLGQGALLSQLTGHALEEGVSYRLTLNIGDRTDMAWPGGEARLVTADGQVIATIQLAPPANGDWSTVVLETGPIAAGLAGLGLRIEIQQTGGSGNQILVDDIRLDVLRPVDIADRLDFLNSTGAWANTETGLNRVDLWIGGLAEKVMPFGGMLGSTFNAVFELQMENLQEGDRFYYLSRTQGLNLLNELENNAFSKLIMANTDLVQPGPDGIRGTEDDIITHHIGVDSFARYDGVLEVNKLSQIETDPVGDDPFLGALRAKVQRDDPTTAAVETNYLRFTGGEHMVMGGTAGNDTIIGGDGDDGIWGGAGDDRIEGGHGVDLVVGGAGDDIITDSGDTGDFIKGESGDDVIANSNGLDVLMGGDGKDVFLVGVDATEVFGGEGDDFVLGGLDHDFLLGNEGDDWMEGGDGFDVLNGDNSELFFNSTILGHDVLIAGENENDFDAESGDDIMVQGESVMRNEGMFGFDWAIYKGSDIAADADMRIPFFTTVADDILRDRFDQTEALSGWDHNDILRGDDRGSDEEIELELSLVNHELSQAGVNRIDGLRELLGLAEYTPENDDVDLEKVTAWTGGNLLIGGDGGDLIEGRGGDDFIHGDAWLNVRIRITGLDPATSQALENTAANEIATVDTLKHVFTAGQVDSSGDPIPAAWVGKSLSELLLTRAIKPSQMHIVREIKYDEDPSNDTDTAVFAGNRDWYEITHVGDRTIVARREMEEVDPQIDEGVDTLVGIERILFADGIYTIRQTGNYDPTGRLTIEGLPAQEGEPLTVNANAIRDLNNPDGTIASGQITYRWQIERNDGTGDYINIPGAAGSSFTPTEEHVGLRIRVIGTYTDGGGVLEVVTSQPTDPVNNVDGNPTGDVLISDMTPTEGLPLTATAAFTDPDGITDAFEEGLLIYQWEYSTDDGATWTSVPAADGGNARTFVPGPELVGSKLRMRIDYTDDGGSAEQVISAVTQVVGNHIVSNLAVIDATAGDAQGGTTIGDDIVLAGGDANQIDGGLGNDSLSGGGGADTLSGGDGNDVINGGLGDDTVDGGAGNDVIIHGNGEGADDIDGGSGSDTLRIVEGVFAANDTVTVALAGGVISSVNGTTSVANVEAAELHLAGGTDTLVYETADDVSVNMLSGAATGFSFIRGVENVVAGSGDDTLRGNGSANALSGRAGNDDLRGGFGNDTLDGGADNDLLYGEEGDDVLEGGDGNDRIDGGAGNDTASYASAAAAVTVSLSATPTRAAFEEQDTGGAGLDRLINIENLVGSAHNDTLQGDGANNIIDGGAGADTMAGEGGDDTYVVDSFSDVITDTSGNDTVETALDEYVLAADAENLVLTGNAAIDGIGNVKDNRLTGNSANNTLNGGGGSDAVVLRGNIAAHTFALAAGQITVASAAGGTDTLVSIERAEIDGASYTIVPGTNAANAGASALHGGGSADLILGFNNNDELHGNGGNDILVGGAGADTMSGGAGDDIYRVQGADLVIEQAGEGIDTIYSDVTRNLTNAAHVQGEVENVVLVGATGTEALSATGNALNNVLTGNEGANTLSGGAGNDTLVGNGGDDNLVGGANDDILDGGAGSDTLNGGGGTDTAVFAGSAGDYAFGLSGAGLATVTHLATGDVDTLSGIERIRFGNGLDLTVVTSVAGIPTGPAILFGSDGDDTIVGGPGEDVIIGGPGDDTLNGSDIGDGDDNTLPGTPDDDIFIWSVGDGSDTINGGMEGVDGDLFQIIGNAEQEVYRIYTYDEAVAGIGFAGSDEAEIVVTREGADGVETIIAVLTEIEEIVVNGAGVSGPGSSGGDTFEMYGDFSVTTSLRPDTITVLGTNGNDTIDVTSLLSAHRIVFRTGGGNDVIIGTLRPQDVIELPDGRNLSEYAVRPNEDGTTTLVGASHSITFMSPNGLPVIVSSSAGDNGTPQEPTEPNQPNEPNEPNTPPGPTDPDPTEPDPTEPDPTEPETAPVVGTAGNDVLIGGAEDDYLIGFNGDDVAIGYGGADILIGGAGADFLSGLAGADTIFGDEGDDTVLGGADADMIYGGDGDDRLFGDGGNDYVSAGRGNDVVVGGAGNDRFVAEAGDGNDSYFGDEMTGGAGTDTLDMSSITANATIDLGTGIDGLGSAVSAATGTDTLWHIENVVSGSGNDRITASDKVNVIDGGTGDDTFVFKTIAAANGDTILGFEAGDKLDLSGIDADAATFGDQAFRLTNSAISGIRDLQVTHETREDGAYTVVQGNVSGTTAPEFKLSIKGTHSLTQDDFNL
ncbi:peroxidase family protein [Devosia sp. ZB163]|uniref:peroxidase family protein n=1 Tax=Devosia sp. ZB163 TaxID=3025938 RepID=UPI00235EB759|nr:peroxidase family protein [Devosia sp. ZB163]MDC9825806.1 peroxidase family protein [Devosia sp. ZB163]